MQWFIKVLKNYVNFNGRARRKEYWFALLFFNIFLIVAGILDMIFGTQFHFGGNYSYTYGYLMEFDSSGYISLLYGIATILPMLAVLIRRLHDQGKSGFWFFIVFIPLVGQIWMLVLLVTNGQRGANQYGPDPKEGIA